MHSENYGYSSFLVELGLWTNTDVQTDSIVYSRACKTIISAYIHLLNLWTNSTSHRTCYRSLLENRQNLWFRSLSLQLEGAIYQFFPDKDKWLIGGGWQVSPGVAASQHPDIVEVLSFRRLTFYQVQFRSEDVAFLSYCSGAVGTLSFVLISVPCY